MVNDATTAKGIVVRVHVKSEIEEGPIFVGEWGTLVDVRPAHHIIEWDRPHRNLGDNTTVIATDDFDTLARVTYFAAGRPITLHTPQAEGLHVCAASTG